LNTSYWNNNGKYSKTLLVEVEAAVKLTGNGPKVEKLLKAKRAYYNAMNNGNYSKFYASFGVGGKQYADSYELMDLCVRMNNSLASNPNTFPTFYGVEAKLDALIEAAHEEIYG